MNTELFEALKLLEKEKGIPVEYMLSQIEKSILVACKSAYGGNNDARVEMDPEKGKFDVYLNKEVVEEVFDPDYEISLQDARAINAKAQLEDKIGVKLDPKQFGRIAVQVARNTIRQGIRDGEKSQVLVEFQSKVQEIVSAQVERVDPKTGNATIRIGKAEAVLPRGEQVAGEVIHEGDTIKVYVADVKNTEKGPRVIISRTHPDFVKRLFEKEVPEIYDGIVEIKSVSREAGSRTKIAVFSRDENVAFSPAEVVKVEVDPNGEKVCKATVPDSQLSLAIGNKGQNARLAAKLTGWKIDIRPESGFFGEDEEDTSDKKEEYIGDGLE